jgi:endonuclease/exonuclease/phosphatase (EEP) superfamily protein YafD
MIVILGLAAFLWIISHDNNDSLNLLVAVLLISATLYQSYRILPYTPVWLKQVKDAPPDCRNRPQISLLVANVLQTNTAHDRIIALVKEYQPDLLLTLETNGRWEKALKNGLQEQYPHSVDVPLENLYGMHLFSKLELQSPSVNFRIREDIPSIDCKVGLSDGSLVNLHFLHPMPPSPSEDYSSVGRDAELALVGKQVGQQQEPTIVAGDMNDVAWSHSARLFRRLSGLLDPRHGRGLYSTFHADYWFARWPLDHVYLSAHFKVIELKRLPHIGSDHFPVFVRLCFDASSPGPKNASPSLKDKQEADESINSAKQGNKSATVG